VKLRTATLLVALGALSPGPWLLLPARASRARAAGRPAGDPLSAEPRLQDGGAARDARRRRRSAAGGLATRGQGGWRRSAAACRGAARGAFGVAAARAW